MEAVMVVAVSAEARLRRRRRKNGGRMVFETIYTPFGGIGLALFWRIQRDMVSKAKARAIKRAVRTKHLEGWRRKAKERPDESECKNRHLDVPGDFPRQIRLLPRPISHKERSNKGICD